MSTVASRRSRLLRLFCALGLVLTTWLVSTPAYAQEPEPAVGAVAVQVQSSPFPPPAANDETFVISGGAGLDTGCTYRNSGPLTIALPVDRFPGDLEKLKLYNLIRPTATLTIAAFDIDSDPLAEGVAPEFDQVFVNGVSKGVLQGSHNLWTLTQFTLSIDEILFPNDPGEGGTLTPKVNSVQIQIDVGNSDEEIWCTAVDWVSLSIDVVKPVFFAHGIFSDGSIWKTYWQPQLDERGMPNAAIDLGALDGSPANALKIGTKIRALQKRWGFDKLNVVSHSKGGLDTRLYVSANDTVDQLVMLATPNGGSPLADSAQSVAVYLLGEGITGKFNFASPGGKQLTTASMRTFNATVPVNPSVTYLAIAGDYSFGGFLKDYAVSAFYGGPNDQIVPVASVFTLKAAVPVATIASEGEDDQGTHGGIHSSETAFQAAIPFLTKLGAAASVAGRPGQSGNGPNAQPPSVATSIESAETRATASQSAELGMNAGQIAAGELQTTTVTIEPGITRAGFVVYSEGANIFSFLTSPSGSNYLPDNNSENYAATTLPGGGRMASYSIENPQPGRWIVNVSALGKQIGEPTALYFVKAFAEGSTITLDLETDQEQYVEAEPILVQATLKDGTDPLLAARVEAMIGAPDAQSVITLELRDDGIDPDLQAGDGIYSARFTQTQNPGDYTFVIEAEGATPLFERNASLTVPVTAARARLNLNPGQQESGMTQSMSVESTPSAGAPIITGLIPDRPAIEDGPITLLDYFDFADFGFGLIVNSIIVQADVLVRSSGLYEWSGLLLAGDGTVVGQSSGSSLLASGSNQINFVFDGASIAESGLNGPFTLSNLTLGLGGFQTTPLGGLTQTYLASQFQGAIPFTIMDLTLNRLGGLSIGNPPLVTAVTNLNNALDPQLWIDPTTLNSGGLAVFDNTANAVQSLLTLPSLRTAGTDPNEVDQAKDDLINAAMHLSAIALERAIAAEGDATLIGDAQQAWESASEMARKGDSVQAIRLYRDAWESAQRAAGHDIVQQMSIFLPVVAP